jgi:anti-sigma B factor antagonist
MLSISSKKINDINVISINGRIVYETEKDFKKYISNFIDQGEIKIVLDCNNLSYVNSAGLGLLINLHKSAKSQGGAINLTNLNSDITELFQITNLNQIFSIFKSPEDAAQAF